MLEQNWNMRLHFRIISCTENMHLFQILPMEDKDKPK